MPDQSLRTRGGKKTRSKFFGNDADGLFVPTPAMWALHAAGKAECRGGRTAGGYQAALRAAGLTDALVSKWGRRYRRLPWFRTWLLKGGEVPAAVFVPTLTQLRAVYHAWDYVGICAEAGLHATSYDRWFQRGLLPSPDWLQWLYGAPAPAGWLVVSEALQAFRRERTHKAVARAAGITPSLVSLWQKNEACRQALALAVAYLAGSGRHSPEALGRHPEWSRLHPATKTSMWRFAEAATLGASCDRAGVGRSVILKALRSARDLDNGSGQTVAAALQRYLHLADHAGPGREYQTEGMIVPGLFVPTGSMLAFQKAAGRRMARHAIWAKLGSVPFFTQWMLDWTTPMPSFGRRSTDGWRRQAKGMPRDVAGASPELPDTSLRQAANGSAAPARPAESLPTSAHPALNETEQLIVAAVRNAEEPPIGRQIAAKLGVRFNSRFRDTLSRLVRRDVLAKSVLGGYTLRS
jgi:hypothetical protein